jgi:hypothetical protein
MTRHLPAGGLLLFLAACASHDSPPAYVIDTLPSGVTTVRNYAPSAWRDSTTWHFEEVTRIEPRDSGAGALVNPGYVAAMDGGGRTYVVDEPPVAIKVFDSAGQYVRTIGRSGEGPGEYRQPRIAIQHGEIYVEDSRLQRITVFDTSGAFIRGFRAESNASGSDGFAIDDSSRILLRIYRSDPPDEAFAFVRYDTLGTVLDTLRLRRWHDPVVWVVEQGAGRATYGIPGGPRELVTITPGGSMLRGWSGTYLLAVQPFYADTTLLISRDWAPVQIPEAERVQRFDQFTGMVSKFLPPDVMKADFHLYDMPTERPPMQDIDVDPAARVWVHTASADTTASYYDVFDATGIWQGTVRAPWHGSAAVVWRGTDRVLVREPDSDGLAAFVVYRLIQDGQDGQDGA